MKVNQLFHAAIHALAPGAPLKSFVEDDSAVGQKSLIHSCGYASSSAPQAAFASAALGHSHKVETVKTADVSSGTAGGNATSP
jgi:hypothetical protein